MIFGCDESGVFAIVVAALFALPRSIVVALLLASSLLSEIRLRRKIIVELGRFHAATVVLNLDMTLE